MDLRCESNRLDKISLSDCSITRNDFSNVSINLHLGVDLYSGGLRIRSEKSRV